MLIVKPSYSSSSSSISSKGQPALYKIKFSSLNSYLYLSQDQAPLFMIDVCLFLTQGSPYHDPPPQALLLVQPYLYSYICIASHLNTYCPYKYCLRQPKTIPDSRTGDQAGVDFALSSSFVH